MEEVRQFRLKKELPTMEKGAIFQARFRPTGNGDIDHVVFRCITPEKMKHFNTNEVGLPSFSGRYVVREKAFFEEVFRVTPEYLTTAELKKYKGAK